jgi:hypothetical protein
MWELFVLAATLLLYRTRKPETLDAATQTLYRDTLGLTTDSEEEQNNLIQHYFGSDSLSSLSGYSLSFESDSLSRTLRHEGES